MDCGTGQAHVRWLSRRSNLPSGPEHAGTVNGWPNGKSRMVTGSVAVPGRVRVARTRHRPVRTPNRFAILCLPLPWLEAPRRALVEMNDGETGPRTRQFSRKHVSRFCSSKRPAMIAGNICPIVKDGPRRRGQSALTASRSSPRTISNLSSVL
jgi:hypothetical protein